MPDADPVDVAIATARGVLVNASREPELNAMASGLLARSLEFSVQGVFLAWDYPVAAPKVQRHFDSVIAAHVPSAVADVIRSVWEAAGQYSDLDLNIIVDGCSTVIDYMEALARAPRPAGLPSPRDLPSIGWGGLSRAEQDLLISVLERTQALCADVRVILVGSRATGLCRPDSDYDLLVIVPDDIRPDIRALVMDAVHRTVVAAGAVPDHHYVTESTWRNPDEGARILVEDSKRSGIEVPPR
jgi:predicted nucleotidyltransferase